MSRFRFELERLERVRRIQEEVERARWLEAETRVRAAEAELARLDAGAAGVRRELAAAQARPRIDVAGALRAQAELERLAGLRRRLEERLRTLRFQAERLRAPWTERKREVSALERLEQRRRAAWRRERERLEARALDEVALERAFRDRGLPVPATAPGLKPSPEPRRSPEPAPPAPEAR
jgi:flagellar export protein FliJ